MGQFYDLYFSLHKTFVNCLSLLSRISWHYLYAWWCNHQCFIIRTCMHTFCANIWISRILNFNNHHSIISTTIRGFHSLPWTLFYFSILSRKIWHYLYPWWYNLEFFIISMNVVFYNHLKVNNHSSRMPITIRRFHNWL